MSNYKWNEIPIPLTVACPVGSRPLPTPHPHSHYVSHDDTCWQSLHSNADDFLGEIRTCVIQKSADKNRPILYDTRPIKLAEFLSSDTISGLSFVCHRLKNKSKVNSSKVIDKWLKRTISNVALFLCDLLDLIRFFNVAVSYVLIKLWCFDVLMYVSLVLRES